MPWVQYDTLFRGFFNSFNGGKDFEFGTVETEGRHATEMMHLYLLMSSAKDLLQPFSQSAASLKFASIAPIATT